MFNLYTYERKKNDQYKQERQLIQTAQSQDKIKAYRDKLFENYSKRISDFLLHMEKQPIKINTYLSPIENAGRVTDPGKFKGNPRIIVREYKTHRERLLV